jgi:hypothetical protein
MPQWLEPDTEEERKSDSGTWQTSPPTMIVGCQASVKARQDNAPAKGNCSRINGGKRMDK